MTDASKLTELTAIYRSLRTMLWEKNVDTCNWPRFTRQRLEATADDIWRDMILLIPVQHNEAIEELLKQNNIAHYGCN